MYELIEGLGWEGEGDKGNKKFCINLNLPGHPDLGIIERGEDWKGLRIDSITERG